jgi:FkbM family methyltransferase
MSELHTFRFYSQQGEDIFVYKFFLNQIVSDGFFVEVGALDGVAGSNTKFFEENLAYSGVLIEPQKQYRESILANRTKSMLCMCAIHPTQSTVRFLGDNAAAGIVETMSDAHKASWYPDSTDYVEVPAFRLGTILTNLQAKHIDFLSIDVEGGELLVLESIDWGSVEIFVICIELDGSNSEKDAACRAILRTQGFSFQTYLGNNDIWVNLAYSKKGNRFGPIKPYDAHFDFLNQESIDKLPGILSSFVSPFYT